MLYHRKGTKRLNSAVFTVLLAIGCFSPNAAAIVISDIFDIFPETRWNCEGECSYIWNYEDYSYIARLTNDPRGKSAGYWVGLGRNVLIEGLTQGAIYTTCTVKFDLQNPYRDSPATASGQIEVINPATWTYIATKSFSFGAIDNAWHAVTTNAFSFPLSRQLYVRVVLHKHPTGLVRRLHIDNMIVQCPIFKLPLL